MSIFEIIMLVCFGATCPIYIYLSYKTKSVAGKSLQFLVILLVGYVSGILHKLTFRYDHVIFLYALNLIMVFTDTMLYLRNKRLAKMQEENVSIQA